MSSHTTNPEYAYEGDSNYLVMLNGLRIVFKRVEKAERMFNTLVVESNNAITKLEKEAELHKKRIQTLQDDKKALENNNKAYEQRLQALRQRLATMPRQPKPPLKRKRDEENDAAAAPSPSASASSAPAPDADDEVELVPTVVVPPVVINLDQEEKNEDENEDDDDDEEEAEEDNDDYSEDDYDWTPPPINWETGEGIPEYPLRGEPRLNPRWITQPQKRIDWLVAHGFRW